MPVCKDCGAMLPRVELRKLPGDPERYKCLDRYVCVRRKEKYGDKAGG